MINFIIMPITLLLSPIIASVLAPAISATPIPVIHNLDLGGEPTFFTGIIVAVSRRSNSTPREFIFVTSIVMRKFKVSFLTSVWRITKIKASVITCWLLARSTAGALTITTTR